MPARTGHLPARNYTNAGHLAARNVANPWAFPALFHTRIMHLQWHEPALIQIQGHYCRPELCKGRGIFQPDIMQMQGHISARPETMLMQGLYFSPKLCRCRGICQPTIIQQQRQLPPRKSANPGALFQPAIIQMHGYLPARNYADAGASASPNFWKCKRIWLKHNISDILYNI